jgi:hypothetical protein
MHERISMIFVVAALAAACAAGSDSPRQRGEGALHPTRAGISVDVRGTNPETHSPSRITVRIQSGDVEHVLVHHVPSNLVVQDIYGALSSKLAAKLGLEQFLPVSAMRGTHVVHLPSGWEVTELRAEKLPGSWKDETGHLAVGNVVVSGSSAMPTALGTPRVPHVPFARITLDVSSEAADPLALEFSVTGLGTAGALRTLEYTANVPRSGGATAALDELADFCRRALGASVSRPTPSTLHLTLDPDVFSVLSLRFAAFEERDTSGLEPGDPLPAWTTTTAVTVGF